MEVYKAETQEILRRYRADMKTRDACIAALDAAAVGLIPTLKPEELTAPRISNDNRRRAEG